MRVRGFGAIVAFVLGTCTGGPLWAVDLLPIGGGPVSVRLGPAGFGPVAVVVQDNATGRCWTNIAETRRHAEEGLRVLGYTLDPGAVGKLEVTVAAWRGEDRACAGTILLRMRNTDFGADMDFAERAYAVAPDAATKNINLHVIAALDDLFAAMTAAGPAP